jgi:MFS family permease
MGVGAVPAGLMTDRWGARPVLTVFFLCTGLSCAAAAMARSALGFAGALTALGATASLYHPTGLAFISHGIARRGTALGIHGIAGSLGLGGSSIGLWMTAAGDWRTAYWLLAGVAVACGLVFPLLPVGEDRAAAVQPVHGVRTKGLSPVLVRMLVLLFAATMLSGFNYRSLMTALPTYLTAESSGVYAGAGRGGIVLAVFVAGGIGQFFTGRFADLASPLGLYVGLVAASVPLALLLAISGGVGGPAAAIAMGLALVHFGTQPAENVLIARLTPANLRSTFYGLKFLVTFGFGALGVLAVGALWRQTGTLAWTFVVFAAVAVGVTLIVLALVRATKVHDAEGGPSTGAD